MATLKGCITSSVELRLHIGVFRRSLQRWIKHPRMRSEILLNSRFAPARGGLSQFTDPLQHSQTSSDNLIVLRCLKGVDSFEEALQASVILGRCNRADAIEHQSSDVVDHSFERPGQAPAVGIAGQREATARDVGEEGAEGDALGLARGGHEPDRHGA